MDRDTSELAFRLLFSSIFLGLGAEHIVDDTLIQYLMPAWVPAPRAVSLGAGIVLMIGGVMVAAGWQLSRAAALLGAFLVVVTTAVHVPAVLGITPAPSGTTEWAWTILQRSNLVKNLCLLGVCFWLRWHEAGRFSLDVWLANR
ncbi:MAG: putative membrane protein YphA (DoxX/SURF4 family) [Myxococcota bacterium]|jgi:uncharacterized membrane protein YphA (DoxX/SURF4 family)